MAKATTKPVEVDYFPVDTMENMAIVVAALMGFGYRTSINMCHGPDGQDVTQLHCVKPLRVDLPAEDSCLACLGDVLVYDGQLTAMSAADFATKYEAT